MSKSPSLRRIQADIRELAKDPSDRYHAAPLEDDMFEWHFTIRGADGTEFEGGIYHGRILLPPEYPFKPPHIIFLTPSGRFETNTKVCLSFSAYHPELWQPAWGIRLILEALISFLPSPADGAIGALDYTKEERKKLAIKSRQFVCPKCGKVEDLLPPLKKKEDICDSDDASGVKKKKANKFDKEVQKLFQLQSANAAADREGAKKRAPPTETDSKATGNNEGQSSPSIHEESKDDVIDAKEEEMKSQKSNDEEQSNMKVDNIETSDTKTTIPESSHDGKTLSPTVVEIDPTEATLTDTTSTLVAAVQDTSTETNETVTSWTDSITDPVLNGSIVTFAIIVFLLFRKVDSLLSELRSLQLDMD